MKIGIVFDDSLDRPDGVQQYVRGIGQWLTGQGHEVHYLVGETKTTEMPHIHSLARNVGVVFNGNRLRIPLPVRSSLLRRLLSEQRFDILHVMMPYSPMLAAKIVRLAPSRTVTIGTFHILPQTWMVKWSTYFLGWWLRSSLRRFDKVFAVSPAARRFAQAAFRLHSVDVLPNVTDVARFAAGEPFECYRDAPDTVPTIVFLGRLVPRKGCGTLIAALGELRDNGCWPLRVVVCGKGPELAALRAQAVSRGVAEAVEFTGFVSEADKPRYLASADLAVFPSVGGESFGIVLIEAMAAGRPVVIAADNPGYASVLEARPEQLFAAGDSSALAAVLRRYTEEPAARQAAVAWQRGYVGQFDVATVGQKLLAEYTAQLQTKRAA